MQNLRWRGWVEGWSAGYERERLGGGVGCQVGGGEVGCKGGVESWRRRGGVQGWDGG